MSIIRQEDVDELTCKPLDTYNEILMFLQNPPPWRSLCKEIHPHSKQLIKNEDMKKDLRMGVSRVFQDGPETYCHVDPDADEVERQDEKSLPKTLVCHDMANGYHDDSFIDGTGNYDAYTFYNWAGIDIFCYFSHHLITIPPLGWINVGHAHGVKVIGTVITEWAEGIAFWDTILDSESEYKNFASALVAIAKTLKFDGWLLNVENKIVKPDFLLNFVQHLHKILHQELKDPVLIWYDSVTIDGHLNWQNALNHKNKAFFDACDGIFTNYSWTEADVQSSAKEAGDRLKDLFIGIDVWGRNFYGGGQFNVQEAVDVAHENGCSLAIFAPAWTHEAMTMDKNDINTVAMADDLNKLEHFMLRDRALWDSIWHFLNTRLPCALPFMTSFCRGQGKKRRLYGEVLCPVPWYNLRHMQYQPNSSHGPHGYLLSTIEHIRHASRHGILRNSKGIIKYREARMLSHVELETVKSIEENSEESGLVPKSDSVSGLTEETTKSTNINTEQQNTNTINEDSENKPRSLNRRIKNIFKHVFQRKSLKTEQENAIEEEPKREPVQEQRKLETIQEQTNENRLASEKPVIINDKNEVAVLDPVIKEQEQNNLDQQKEEKNKDPEKVEEQEDADDIEPKTFKGRSMVQMSVNIHLKSAAKTRYGLAYVRDERQCLEVHLEDSFIGGSCLKVNPSDELSPEHRLIRIFHCDFFCEDALIVCVVTKHLRGFEEQYLNVKLNMTDGHGMEHRVVLIGRNLAHARKPQDSTSCFLNLYPFMHSEAEFKDIQKYLLLNEPNFYVPVENSYNWIVRYYEIHLPGSRVTSVNCDTGLDKGPMLLGHIGICQRVREPEIPNGSSKITTAVNGQNSSNDVK